MIWRTLIGEMPYLLAGALVALRLLFYFIALGLVLGVALALMQIYGNRPLLASAFVFERFFRGVPAIVLLFRFYHGLW